MNILYAIMRMNKHKKTIFRYEPVPYTGKKPIRKSTRYKGCQNDFQNINITFEEWNDYTIIVPSIRNKKKRFIKNVMTEGLRNKVYSRFYNDNKNWKKYRKQQWK